MDSFSKCYTFGIRKNKTTTEQLQPYITIPQKLLLLVEKDKSFSNLGKYFNFKINSDEIKAKLKDKIRKNDETIDKLPIKCFHKKTLRNVTFSPNRNGSCFFIIKLKLGYLKIEIKQQTTVNGHVFWLVLTSLT